ncbi:MAG: MerR family transcriptional regulator [Gemmatimonadaceae bacterium]|nr:MerR family transcriptional regulator [Gemmatimonadaceae bacterium]
MAVSSREPVQEFFSIGEVCSLTELKPHVLRYWEGQFRFLSPAKNRSGNRVYQRREVELIQLVKHLLYTEKYTIQRGEAPARRIAQGRGTPTNRRRPKSPHGRASRPSCARSCAS